MGWPAWADREPGELGRGLALCWGSTGPSACWTALLRSGGQSSRLHRVAHPAALGLTALCQGPLSEGHLLISSATCDQWPHPGRNPVLGDRGHLALEPEGLPTSGGAWVGTWGRRLRLRGDPGFRRQRAPLAPLAPLRPLSWPGRAAQLSCGPISQPHLPGSAEGPAGAGRVQGPGGARAHRGRGMSCRPGPGSEWGWGCEAVWEGTLQARSPTPGTFVPRRQLRSLLFARPRALSSCILSASPFYGCEKGGPERLVNLPRVTQQSGGDETQT